MRTRGRSPHRSATASPWRRQLKKANAADPGVAAFCRPCLTRGELGLATRAVIGTLRPTDQRRATLKKGQFYARMCPDVIGADGAEGSRTPDLCSAIAALSQLSYSPVP